MAWLQVTKAMPRLVENPGDRLGSSSPIAVALARLGPAKGERPFFQLVTENNDTPKQVTDIIKGVTNIVLKVQAVLNDMESKYKKIWDTDKDAYMRRYRKNPDVRDFDGDIKVYLDHIDEIRGEESTINIDFLHIDQQPIKAVRPEQLASWLVGPLLQCGWHVDSYYCPSLASSDRWWLPALAACLM